jgi:hypothetical protein
LVLAAAASASLPCARASRFARSSSSWWLDSTPSHTCRSVALWSSVQLSVNTLRSTRLVTVADAACSSSPAPAVPTSRPPPKAATAITQVTHLLDLRAGGC